MRNFSKRVVWGGGDRKLNLNVCHRERGASGFMFRNHSLQRCNLLIGERERERYFHAGIYETGRREAR